MTGEVSRRPRVVGALALLVALQSATPAWAWGRLGHRVIAQLAEKRLGPKAKAGIKALLPEGESLADASTWADEQLRQAVIESGRESGYAFREVRVLGRRETCALMAQKYTGT